MKQQSYEQTVKREGNTMTSIEERFEFRNIRPEEADQAAQIEQICFPPNEACSEKMMKERVLTAPEFFLVAVDKETGKTTIEIPVADKESVTKIFQMFGKLMNLGK